MREGGEQGHYLPPEPAEVTSWPGLCPRRRAVAAPLPSTPPAALGQGRGEPPVCSNIRAAGPPSRKADALLSLSKGSDGMRIVYAGTASSSTISMPVAKLRMGAFRSGKVPSWKNSRKSATYPLISLLGQLRSPLQPSSGARNRR